MTSFHNSRLGASVRRSNSYHGRHKVIAAGIAALGMGMAAAPAHAQAADTTGFYLGLHVGISSVSDTDITYYDTSGTFGGTGQQDTAVGVFDVDKTTSFGGSIGYDFGMIRSDIELDYSRAKINSLTISQVNGQAITLSPEDRAEVCDYLEVDTCGGSGNTFEVPGARVRQASAFLNAWVDLPIGGVIAPYAGGGVGVAGFETDGEGTAKFAWQLGAGVAAHFSETVAVTLDYRRRQLSAADIAYDANSGFELGKLKTDTFAAGVRFTF